ncbi:MAG TPA: PaaI family thioesterase [Microvirga sp.]|jgi:uncharacterized protein (TIGR00369 family)|nr:PaaI family thioesterase [Microvirga sp.]
MTEPGTAPEIFGAVIAFANHCGIEPLEIGDGRSRLRVALGPEHGNNLGIAHGGLICTLLDVAMGSASRSKVGRAVITLDMQVSFLSPGRGVLVGEGRVLRAGRSVVFCEAEVRDEAGELVAKASGLFKPTAVRET